MKRSDINGLIDEAIRVLQAHNFKLPPFAYWSPADWAGKGPECDEIRQCKLGWDVTDFGTGAFDRVGLVVFTIRNGHHKITPYTQKPYAEKILVVRENQRTPMHCHMSKSEDIICRSGGILECQVYNKDPRGGLAQTEVNVSLDGIQHRVRAGHVFTLMPGMSITLTPFIYHEFWAKGGTSIVGEVSMVNDDDADNDFFPPLGRFPSIEEDVPATHKLCTEY